jgi:hypothetical protein
MRQVFKRAFGWRFVRKHPRVHKATSFGLLTIGLVVLAGPLMFDEAAHRALNDRARVWGSWGSGFFGLEVTVARASVFSLVRDMRQDLELYDHDRRIARRSINLGQYLTRGSLKTIGDLVDAFNVPLTKGQAASLGLCRELDDLKPGEKLVVQSDPYQYGIASWYGPGFHGRLAASGEIYNMYDLTAAHRTLRLQSLVRVVHQRTGESVVVRINDRGPYVGGRVLDLSLRAKQKLGMNDLGAIFIEVLDPDITKKPCPID